MRSTSPSNNQTDLLSYSFGESMPLADLAPFARDMLFYQKRKKEKCRLVSPPKFDAPIADTHAHLDMLGNPALALARSAFYGIKFICTIVDVQEDDRTTFEQLDSWFEEAKRIYDSYELPGFEFAKPKVRVGIGCHPHNAKFYDDALEEKLFRTCAIRGSLRSARWGSTIITIIHRALNSVKHSGARSALLTRLGCRSFCICVKLTMMGSLSCKKRDFLKRGYCCTASTLTQPFSSRG